jgi:hypothetical protein
MNVDSSKAVEVFGGSTTDGAKISQWDYSGGKNQRWQLVDVGGGYYKIKNLKSGKVLEVTGGSTTNGALVAQWTDNGGTNQQWQIVDVGNGYSKLINRKSGKALDSGGTTADGAQLTQWTDNGGDNQKKWQLAYGVTFFISNSAKKKKRGLLPLFFLYSCSISLY